MGEETVSKNFIEQEIDKDLKEYVYQEVCTPFSTGNRTDTFTSDTLKSSF